MDSGNSGSMQSSSGGDEDYDDSKAESSPPVLLNSSPAHTNNIGSFSSSHSPFPYFHQNNHLPSLYDSASTFVPTYTHPNPNLATAHFDLGMLRGDPRSDAVPGGPSSSSQGMLLAQGASQGQPYPTSSSSSSLQAQLVHEAPRLGRDDRAKAARNPRKRTRASRRAPTTVLTTDTTNFRAMVQEFTGFPAPPFSGPRKLDLFGGASSIGPFFHPLRPSAQKLDANMVSNTISHLTTSMANNFRNTGSHSVPPSTFQFNLQKQPQNPLALQNNVLTFPSLTHDPLSAANLLPGFGLNSQDKDLDMSPANFNPNWPDGLASHENTVRTSEVAWREGGRSNGGKELEQQLRPFSETNYGNPSQSFNGCKLNYSASSSSEFHNDKSLENSNVSARGEGRVDYWISPSD
ncbi:uncharacterized protein LOC115749009 [Rhodamnia argentea]|uniref:Uncharacterized protein LOC115749009 n=1 Tax=Rhodamnia argentea TaxID=178133 RepID=A0ABM3H1B8_9MYRT|nr:uncharacterized protein LOC115749009 [Rhodamnia argentea]XP_048130375.1 uncharacterized protein LOC115749009 [Rhodamnia argentea]